MLNEKKIYNSPAIKVLRNLWMLPYEIPNFYEKFHQTPFQLISSYQHFIPFCSHG